jgi:pentatricopeptide repeat protein
MYVLSKSVSQASNPDAIFELFDQMRKEGIRRTSTFVIGFRVD